LLLFLPLPTEVTINVVARQNNHQCCRLPKKPTMPLPSKAIVDATTRQTYYR